MLDLPFFWLGPAAPFGSMVPLACPASDVNTSIEVTGEVKASLRGRNMRDVQSYRRQWELTSAYLDDRDRSYLETLLVMSHERSLRFIDPLIVNRARLFASLTSNFQGFAQVKDAWYSTAGVVSFPEEPWPILTGITDGDARLIEYAPTRVAQWTLSGSAGTLSVNGRPSTDLTPLVAIEDVDIVLPGETVTLSAYVRTTTATNIRARLQAVDMTSNSVASFDSLAFSESASVAPASWTRISTTLTNANSNIGVFPQFRTTSTTGSVLIAGIQINKGSTPLPFTRGGGGAEVILTEVSAASPRFPLVNIDIALLEV